jgi:cytochrome c oxidase assembly factor 7
MERAFSYALKGCDLGSMESCVNLSIMYRKGEGVARDESLAQKYADAAREIQLQQEAGRRQLKFGEGAE